MAVNALVKSINLQFKILLVIFGNGESRVSFCFRSRFSCYLFDEFVYFKTERIIVANFNAFEKK